MVAIHGDLKQFEREKHLETFRTGVATIMVSMQVPSLRNRMVAILVTDNSRIVVCFSASNSRVAKLILRKSATASGLMVSAPGNNRITAIRNLI